jgi:hypothetical protein
MALHRIVALTLAGLVAGFVTWVGPAQAEPAKFTWQGVGENVMGSSKCPGYTLKITAYVENGRIWGEWQQTGRVVRSFEFPLAADGSFSGQVDLQASIMNVKGQASADDARFDMRGYCIFGGRLKKE